MAPASQTQRVAGELTRQVRGLQPGDELGTVASVAKQYGVSRDVAYNALQLLIRHGLIRAEARRHVVADPTAPLSEAEAIAELRERVAELERWRAEQDGGQP